MSEHTRDSAGRIATINDSDGRRWRMEYHGDGYTAIELHADGTDTRYVHDAQGIITHIDYPRAA